MRRRRDRAESKVSPTLSGDTINVYFFINLAELCVHCPEEYITFYSLRDKQLYHLSVISQFKLCTIKLHYANCAIMMMIKNQAFQEMPGNSRHAKCLNESGMSQNSRKFYTITQFACSIYICSLPHTHI